MAGSLFISFLSGVKTYPSLRLRSRRVPGARVHRTVMVRVSEHGIARNSTMLVVAAMYSLDAVAIGNRRISSWTMMQC